MGFLSFHLNYYNEQLKLLKNKTPNEDTVYLAKQLLKIVDDLLDEGYPELSDALENDSGGVTWLRTYLRSQNAVPFINPTSPTCDKQIIYGGTEVDLKNAISFLTAQARTIQPSVNPFLRELRTFSEWIGYEQDTAYIFLLRDTLLPYIYFESRGRTGIYPWLLGRQTLDTLCGTSGTDDALRISVTDALEHGNCKDFDSFCKRVLPSMRQTISMYPDALATLKNLLDGIREPHITVVESGCTGTFPLLLMSLDNRVVMRMYTTYPYLADIYHGKIFTKRYEDVRLFETLVSQDVLMRFSSLKNGTFFVNLCKDADIKQNALREISKFLK